MPKTDDLAAKRAALLAARRDNSIDEAEVDVPTYEEILAIVDAELRPRIDEVNALIRSIADDNRLVGQPLRLHGDNLVAVALNVSNLAKAARGEALLTLERGKAAGA